MNAFYKWVSDPLKLGAQAENVLKVARTLGHDVVLVELQHRRQAVRRELELINSRINAVKNAARYANRVGPKEPRVN